MHSVSIMSIDNSVAMYCVKHSSHGNHFQIKLLSVGQHAKFTWPTWTRCEIWVGRSFALMQIQSTWPHGNVSQICLINSQNSTNSGECDWTFRLNVAKKFKEYCLYFLVSVSKMYGIFFCFYSFLIYLYYFYIYTFI